MTRIADTKTFRSLFDHQIVELFRNASLIDKSKYEEGRTKDENAAELQETGELSSISGSESEDSQDASSEDFEMEGTVKRVLPDTVGSSDPKQTVVTQYRNHPKLFLLSEDGQLFTVYRATVFSARTIPESELDLINKIKQSAMESLWVIIMTAGGHFAAAVFNGNSVVAHKTFHRYTVRAKRGKTQGVRDSQQGMQKGL